MTLSQGMPKFLIIPNGGRLAKVRFFQPISEILKDNRINYLARLNPLLAGIFPVTFLYNQNIDEAPFMTALAVVLATVAGVLAFGLAVRFLIRDDGAASLVTVIWLVLFFSQGTFSIR